MKKLNKTCIVCGAKYTFCPTCSHDEPAWKNIYHDENCKNIYDICGEVINGNISAKESKELFDKCDLSIKESLHHVLKDIVNQAYGFDAEIMPAPVVEETVVAHEEADELVAEAESKPHKRMEKKPKK